MIRRLFLNATAWSLLMCVGVLAVWVRSYWRNDLFQSVYWGPCTSGRGTACFGQYDSNCYTVMISRGAIFAGYNNQRFDVPAAQKQIVRSYVAQHEGYRHRSLPPLDPYPTINYPKLQSAGFKYGITLYRPGNSPSFGRAAVIPFWFVTLLLALKPVMWLAKEPARLRKRRAARGQCVCCGYDLRASAGRCPECGTPVHSPPTAP
jgi:hypothetical protein